LDDCTAVGYPAWKPKSPEGFRNPAQLTGEVPTAEHITRSTATGQIVRLLSLRSDLHDGVFRAAATKTAPAREGDAPPTGTGPLDDRTPWSGMSGAVVVDPQDRVLGVVRSHNLSEGRGSLTLTPVDAIDLLPDATRTRFRRCLTLPPAGGWPAVPASRAAEPLLRAQFDALLDGEVYACFAGRQDVLARIDEF
jgi:hypothetical protein